MENKYNCTSIFASGVSDRSFNIRLCDGRMIMIDMGCVNLSLPEVDALTLFRRYLAELQEICGSEVITVAAVFLTHPHDDHANLLEKLHSTGLDKYFNIERIIRKFPPKDRLPSNGWEDPEYPERLEACLKSFTGTELITANIGDRFTFGEDTFEILITADEAPMPNDCNGYSTLIMQHSRGKKILWTGDASNSLTQKAMELVGDGLKCDILQIPHHGTPNGGVFEFFEHCGAKLHLWNIARETFTRPDYPFCYGKYPIPTKIFDMPQEKIFCGGGKAIEIPLSP